MLFATLAIANTTPAEAHTPYVTTDCREWSVTLVSYGGSTDTLKNTVQVWEVIDGDDIVLVDTAFGSSFSDSGTWDPTVDHTLRVKVVAIHSSYSFDDTWESTGM